MSTHSKFLIVLFHILFKRQICFILEHWGFGVWINSKETQLSWSKVWREQIHHPNRYYRIFLVRDRCLQISGLFRTACESASISHQKNLIFGLKINLNYIPLSQLKKLETLEAEFTDVLTNVHDSANVPTESERFVEWMSESFQPDV